MVCLMLEPFFALLRSVSNLLRPHRHHRKEEERVGCWFGSQRLVFVVRLVAVAAWVELARS